MVGEVSAGFQVAGQGAGFGGSGLWGGEVPEFTPQEKSFGETPLARPAAGRGSYLRVGLFLTGNLGSGVVAKRRMGFEMEEEEGGHIEGFRGWNAA